jgi:hypothetical protein
MYTLRLFSVNNCMGFGSFFVSLNCGSGAMTFPVMSEGVREVTDSHISKYLLIASSPPGFIQIETFLCL